jgi:hypothetical protein
MVEETAQLAAAEGCDVRADVAGRIAQVGRLQRMRSGRA